MRWSGGLVLVGCLAPALAAEAPGSAASRTEAAATYKQGPRADEKAAKAPDKKKAARKAADTKPAKKKPALDRSGKKQRGKASFYSRSFAGRPMADGTPMNPESNVAASTTLPLGTKARVTHLENGRSAVVEIRDRGPYVEGRTIDVTPKTARQLDMVEEGVAPVEVAPLEVPQQDGSIKRGAGAEG